MLKLLSWSKSKHGKKNVKSEMAGDGEKGKEMRNPMLKTWASFQEEKFVVREDILKDPLTSLRGNSTADLKNWNYLTKCLPMGDIQIGGARVIKWEV
jgi:hypothetical protein